MDEYESLSHSKWECKYHVVFIPKCRSKTLYGELRRHLGEVFRKLAVQKESRIEEGHLMPDHVHMMISIPPKYAVSQVVGFIKGRSAIHLARVYGGRKRRFVGQNFWARGYFVSTVGRDEAVIREYIKKREQEDSRLDQMNLWRVEGDHYVAIITDGKTVYPPGTRIPVPNEKMKWDAGNPTGHGVIFLQIGTAKVYCYVAPGGV
jgi:putative transposase